MTRITMTSADILAAIAFQAQSIIAATGQHAAGAPFPDPKAIEATLKRMGELNQYLMDYQSTMQAPSANTEAA